MTGVDDDRSAVEAANAELYAAFEAGDLDRMAAVWDDDGDDASNSPIVCVHPGWPGVRGRGRVLRSWALIMANTAYIQFFLLDVAVWARGDVAVVCCEENILTGVGSELSGSARVVATNVFHRRDGRWKIRVHHGSPVLSPSAPLPGESP